MKTWWLSAALSVALLIGLRPGIVRAQDIGNEVRRVFAAKCAGCHGPDLPKPRGRFGYVLDLRRVAGNPEMVIPSRPDESELWVLVERDEMPPSDSPHGALTLEQKETIRTWIASGAPDAAPLVLHPCPSERSEQTVPTAVEMIWVDRFLRWLGKFHLLLLHFPIALVLAAGAGEVRSAWQRNRVPSEAVRFCLWLGALVAIPTAGLGWLFAAAGNGASSPPLLAAHRWLGTTASVLLVLTAVCAERDVRRGARSRSVRLLLLSGVLLTALTAHLGGLLSRGSDFFVY
jgi:uncharacterized membrane protein